MPGGRPSKYKPEFCKQAIDLMKIGASKYELCLEFFVCEDTIYEWAKVHPEFSEALKIGSTLSQGWWERQGRLHVQNREFNSTLWYMNMKNRFGWRDKQDIEANVKSVSHADIVDYINKAKDGK